MIKPSLIIVLSLIVVVLVAAVFLIQEDRPAVMPPDLLGKPLVKEFAQASIKAIDIKKGDVAVKLEKKDNNWYMPTHKDRLAKLDRVEQLLGNIGTAAVEGTRSGSADLFQLDDKNRTEVVLTGENGKQTLFLGKSPDYSKAFVRTELNGPILEIDRGLDSDAGIRTEKEERVLDPSYFYDLKVFSFGADELIDMQITKGAEKTRVQKVVKGKGPVQPKQEPAKDDPAPTWAITEPAAKEVDEGAVNGLTSTLANLNAKSFADTVPEKDRGLDQPSAVVKFVLKDGKEMTLTFGKVDGDEVVMAVSGRPDAYKVYKYVFDSVTKDLVKKQETPPSTEQKTDNLPNAPKPPVAPPEKVQAAPTNPAPVVPPPPAQSEKKETAPPPPATIQKDEKPVVPPAVVKQPDPGIKPDNKK